MMASVFLNEMGDNFKKLYHCYINRIKSNLTNKSPLSFFSPKLISVFKLNTISMDKNFWVPVLLLVFHLFTASSQSK